MGTRRVRARGNRHGGRAVPGGRVVPWHEQMPRVPVLLALAAAAGCSVAAALAVGAVNAVSEVWLAGLVLAAAFRYGPKGVVPAAAVAGALAVDRLDVRLGVGPVGTFGAVAAAYLAFGLGAAGAFHGLFRRLTAEHQLRIREVEEQRNRVLQGMRETERLQRELEHSASHDPLTGLANRSLLLARVQQALTQAAAGHRHCALLFLDLDDFKTVNDSLGHGAGDQLLQVVGQRLQEGCRASDVAARLGGDEFAVLLTNFDPVAADQVLDRVLRALSPPVSLSGREVVIGASAGLAVSNGEDTPLAMLGKADLAMYEVKSRGKGAVAIFHPTMQVSAQHRAELEADLRSSVRDGDIDVAYQPIVDIRSGRLAGFEALARWTHPSRGAIGPDVFIPLAEATGAIVPLGLQVFERACRQLRVLQRRVDQEPALCMSVNLSARQLAEPDFLSQVSRVLTGSGVNPPTVVLEITESLVMDDDDAARALGQLRALGLRLAVDDFGAGYSSLQRLSWVAPSRLKIDKSFVGALGGPDGGTNAALVDATIAMAHRLGIEVVAEGVETAEQLALLRQMGCDFAQGYLLGRPGPVDLAGLQLDYPLLDPDAALPTGPAGAEPLPRVLPSLQPTGRRDGQRLRLLTQPPRHPADPPAQSGTPGGSAGAPVTPART